MNECILGMTKQLIGKNNFPVSKSTGLWGSYKNDLVKIVGYFIVSVNGILCYVIASFEIFVVLKWCSVLLKVCSWHSNWNYTFFTLKHFNPVFHEKLLRFTDVCVIQNAWKGQNELGKEVKYLCRY